MLLYLDRQLRTDTQMLSEKGEASVVVRHLFHVFTVSEMNRVKCGIIVCVFVYVCRAGQAI